MKTKVLRALLVAFILAVACSSCAGSNEMAGKPVYFEKNRQFKKMTKCSRKKCKDCVVFKESKQAKKPKHRKK